MMRSRYEHPPQGDPCAKCGKAASAHRESRPQHPPQGDPCAKCGKAASKHRKPSVRRFHGNEKPKHFIGIDGEGQGREKHLYVLLAASDEAGRSWYKHDSQGLATTACLDFILSLPKEATLVMFSFHYDLTKMLEQVSDTALYELFHQDNQTPGKEAPPVRWGPYLLRLQGRARFSVSKIDPHTMHVSSTRVIWDVFRFFSCSFVRALRLCGVGLA